MAVRSRAVISLRLSTLSAPPLLQACRWFHCCRRCRQQILVCDDHDYLNLVCGEMWTLHKAGVTQRLRWMALITNEGFVVITNIRHNEKSLDEVNTTRSCYAPAGAFVIYEA